MDKYVVYNTDSVKESVARYEKYRNELSSIITDWKKERDEVRIYGGKNDVFVSDGVVNPKIWFGNTIRPLYILKEAYGGNEDWDLVDWLREKNEDKYMAKTWRTICSWTDYIFNKKCGVFNKWNSENVQELLQKIAVINIKKYGGQSLSCNTDLKNHAVNHSDLIFKQIELTDPTIIVCGYTGWLLDVAGQNKKDNIMTVRQNGSGRVYFMTINGRNIPLVDFWHPACRTNHIDDFKKDIDAIFNNLKAVGNAPVQPPEPDDSENECK